MDLNKIDVALKAMTPAPWRADLAYVKEEHYGVIVVDTRAPSDADGIALLRNSARAMTRRIREQDAEIARLRNACSRLNEEVCQVLGKALGFPWFKDDQKNFPGYTEEDGVCVGDNVAESMADMAAAEIARLRELCGDTADEYRQYESLSITTRTSLRAASKGEL